MKRYKCINEMMIEVVDGDGVFIENKYNFIEKGSIWELDDSDFRVCDGEVRLLAYKNDRHSWIEMPYEDLEKYFEEVEEVQMLNNSDIDVCCKYGFCVDILIDNVECLIEDIECGESITEKEIGYLKQRIEMLRKNEQAFKEMLGIK